MTTTSKKTKPVQPSVEIGGVRYRKRRMNWEQSRQLQKESRAQTKATRAAERAQATVEELDGTELARVEERLNTYTDPDDPRKTRDLGRLGELQEIAGRDVDELEQQIDEAQDLLEEAQHDQMVATFRLLELQLETEKGEPGPTVEVLQAELDIVEDLPRVLALVGAGDETDPTPSTRTTSTTGGT